MNDDIEVRAAGGIVWRRAKDGVVEVAVVHRDRYDDWTFPKGKLDPDEGWEAAAVREVHEETGLVVTLDDELPSVRYRDHRGRPKLVRYWVMSVVRDEGHEPDDEVDELRWLPVGIARDMLTYPHDVELLEHFAATDR